MNRMRWSFGVIAVVIATVVVIIVATSGGAAKTPGHAVVPASSISVKQTSLGKTLVDANGRTLYLFEADKRDQSTLSAAGARCSSSTPPTRCWYAVRRRRDVLIRCRPADG